MQISIVDRSHICDFVYIIPLTIYHGYTLILSKSNKHAYMISVHSPVPPQNETCQPPIRGAWCSAMTSIAFATAVPCAGVAVVVAVEGLVFWAALKAASQQTVQKRWARSCSGENELKLMEGKVGSWQDEERTKSYLLKWYEMKLNPKLFVVGVGVLGDGK